MCITINQLIHQNTSQLVASNFYPKVDCRSRNDSFVGHAHSGEFNTRRATFSHIYQLFRET